MSFHTISIAIRAENRASYAFRAIAGDAVQLAYSFGLIDTQTHRMISGIMAAVHLFTSLKAVLGMATAAQTVHNTAVATGTTVQTTSTGAQVAHTAAVGAGAVAETTLTGATIATTGAQTAQNVATNTGIISQFAHRAALLATSAAHGIHAAGAWIATAAQNALNISYSTFLVLTGVGIAVVLAAAVAMWSFANSMNAATSSVKDFNSAAGEVPGVGRSIRRAGEEEYYRHGVEY